VRPLLLTQVATTLGMVAVIWFVQLVHYPLFAQVGEAGFPRYEALHTQRISLIVIPLMVAEAATAGWLLFIGAPWASRTELAIGAGLVLLVWAVTFFFSVPCHGRLAQGFDAATHARLVATNWLRTAGWSARGGLVLLWLWRAVG